MTIKPLKLIIVGGVAGGATAAARARRLNEFAEIIYFERGDYISFANCGLPNYVSETIRGRDKLMVPTPEALKKSYRIDVRTGAEVLAGCHTRQDERSSNCRMLSANGLSCYSLSGGYGLYKHVRLK